MADRLPHVQAEMDGMRAVPDTGAEPWVTRLKPPHPVHVAGVAGALVTVTGSLTQAYMVAYTLNDAGLLAPAQLRTAATNSARVAYDRDGHPWREVEPDMFRADCEHGAQCASPDKCGMDEAPLADIVSLYGLRSLAPAAAAAAPADDEAAVDEAAAAIATVARYIVARSYGGPAATVVEIDWSDYPEIGEHDWQAVLDRANELVTAMRPDEETYQQAYRLLTDRADEELGYR